MLLFMNRYSFQKMKDYNVNEHFQDSCDTFTQAFEKKQIILN